MDIEAKIRSLKKKEVATLFLICYGQSNPQISLALNEPSKTTSSRITRIYKKLEITGDDQEKRISLLRDYCPTVKNIITNIDDLRFWVPYYPTPEVKAKYEIIEVETRDEDEGDDDQDNEEVNEWVLPLPPGPPSQEPPTPPPPQPPPPEKRDTVPIKFVRQLMLIFLGIIGVLVLVIIWLIFFRYPPENPPISANNPAIVSASTLGVLTTDIAVVPTQTSVAISESLTRTPQPSVAPTSTLTAVPSSTPTITQTPAPSQTPTETPVPSPTLTILMRDTFDDGLDQWQVLTGDPLIVNGELTGKEGQTSWLATGDPNWRNIKVEILTTPTGCAAYYDTPIFIAVRFVDMNNMLGFKYDSCTFIWYEKVNGRWSIIPNTQAKASGEQQTIDIIANGDQYSAYTQGMQINSFYDNKFKSGRVAVLIGEGMTIDEITIYQLP
jgi:DNA-binding CsgD family transcriptional regulator